MEQLFGFSRLVGRPFVAASSFNHHAGERLNIIIVGKGLAIRGTLEPMFGIEGRIDMLRLVMHAQESNVLKACERLAIGIAKKNLGLGRTLRDLNEMNFSPGRGALRPNHRTAEPARQIGRLGIIELMAKTFGEDKEEPLKRAVNQGGRKNHAAVCSAVARGKLNENVGCDAVFTGKSPGGLNGLEGTLVRKADLSQRLIECFYIATTAFLFNTSRPRLVLGLGSVGRDAASCQMQERLFSRKLIARGERKQASRRHASLNNLCGFFGQGHRTKNGHIVKLDGLNVLHRKSRGLDGHFQIACGRKENRFIDFMTGKPRRELQINRLLPQMFGMRYRIAEKRMDGLVIEELPRFRRRSCPNRLLVPGIARKRAVTHGFGPGIGRNRQCHHVCELTTHAGPVAG